MSRVYIPLALAGLRALREEEQIPPGSAYAVTPALRAALASELSEEEDLEYVVMSFAARSSLTLLDPADPADRRRVVVAADAPSAPVAEVERGEGHATPEGGHVMPGEAHPAQVRLLGAVPLARIASVHVDTDDLRSAVEEAVRALPAAEGDARAMALVDALDGEDLAWFAVQEIDDVLGD